MKNTMMIILTSLFISCKNNENSIDNISDTPSFIQIEHVDSNYLVTANNYLLEKFNDSVDEYIFGHYYVFEHERQISYYDTTHIYLIVRTFSEQRYEFQFKARVNTSFIHIVKDNEIIFVNTDFPNPPGSK